jgi:citrate lyase subunit beta/citryl-CoA lyase
VECKHTREVTIFRSFLFVPGNRPDRFAKAFATGADVVIIDLQDSVPLAEKRKARSNVEAWLASSLVPVIIRINGVETNWFREDAVLCTKSGIGAVILPKAERIEDILGLHDMTQRPILPLVETARGFCNAAEIANAPCVRRLVFGSLDLQLDLGTSGVDEELSYFRSMLVLISRAAGLEKPVDGVTTDIDNPLQLRNDTIRAKRFGFGAKLCIHPKQVEIVNQCFGPTAEEKAWARRVIGAIAGSGGAPVVVDGKMVDRPLIARAEEILATLNIS